MQNGPSSAAGLASASGPSFTDASFAGLLASVAAPQEREAPWNDDQLADDIASISYEQALRAHSRVRPRPADAEPFLQPGEHQTKSDPSAADKPLKTSSITIRLSETECAQLRRRAAEAGMTVSAYLRSCTLEVESLRAQVKHTLAELRSTAVKPEVPQMEIREPGWLSAFLRGLKVLLCRLGPTRRLSLRINPANPFAPLQG